MFKITEGKGFHMTFANGYTVSVQWGTRNYCENQTVGLFDADYYKVNREKAELGCKNAEVAVWHEDTGFDRFEESSDDVIGWRSPEQVVTILCEVAQRPRPVKDQ